MNIFPGVTKTIRRQPRPSSLVTVQPPHPAPPHCREGSGSTPPPLWERLRGGEQLPSLGVSVFLGVFLALVLSLFSPGIQAQEQTTAGRGFSLPVVRAFAVNDPDAFVYTVRLGEYWILIARKFGVSYNDLRAANPELWTLRGEIIRPGDEMAIPGLTAADQRPTVEVTVQPGDSWYAIADRFGVTYWDLRLDNLGLWRRRGAVIQPGDMMQVVNPAPAAAKEAAVAVAQSVAAPTPPPQHRSPLSRRPLHSGWPLSRSRCHLHAGCAPGCTGHGIAHRRRGWRAFPVSNPRRMQSSILYGLGTTGLISPAAMGWIFEKLRSGQPEL